MTTNSNSNIPKGGRHAKDLHSLCDCSLVDRYGHNGSAVARDRSDRTELTSSQITDHASARAAQMKVDLRLTAEQEKNWSAFETVVVDIWKKQTQQQFAWRNARAKEQGGVDLIDEMRKDADDQIDRSNARTKLADAAQPLYGSLDDQQKRRFSQILFRRDRDRHSY